ncbi:hypothetical protein KCP75_20575 [Salmonella enterica subsp. enterica]|nr:hypothetical protein KCP75_20575 [Salmonella enterica subsp. enterica]
MIPSIRGRGLIIDRTDDIDVSFSATPVKSMSLSMTVSNDGVAGRRCCC